MPQAVASPVSWRLHARRATCRSRRSFAAVPSPTCVRRGAVATGDRAGLGDPDPAEGLGAAVLLRRPADGRHCSAVGPAQPAGSVGRLPAAAVEAVTREFLALAQAEFSPN